MPKTSFQNSYSPAVVGALEVLANAYSSNETEAPVKFEISKYLLFEEPSAYSEINISFEGVPSSRSVIVTVIACETVSVPSDTATDAL